MVLPVPITDMTDDGNFFITGDNKFAVFTTEAHGASAFITGKDDSVSFNWRDSHGNDNRVFDSGHGTQIDIGYGTMPELYPKLFPPETAQLWGFQNDPTGKINADSPSVTLRPDGWGGTMVSGLNWQLDVVGDRHLTMAQITVS